VITISPDGSGGNNERQEIPTDKRISKLRGNPHVVSGHTSFPLKRDARKTTMNELTSPMQLSGGDGATTAPVQGSCRAPTERRVGESGAENTGYSVHYTDTDLLAPAVTDMCSLTM